MAARELVLAAMQDLNILRLNGDSQGAASASDYRECARARGRDLANWPPARACY